MISEKLVPWFLSSKTKLWFASRQSACLKTPVRMIEAGNSDEAIELLVADSDVQLLFTDVNMPGTIDGLALARQVHDRSPHIGIMVASAKRRAT